MLCSFSRNSPLLVLSTECFIISRDNIYIKIIPGNLVLSRYNFDKTI